MQVSDVRAVITGGVSGLGLAVAQHLVARGAKVALFDINDDKGAAAVAELGAGKARYFRTDVTDEANVQANVAAARDFLGGLNAAINCAGILGAGRVVGKEGAMPLKQFAGTVMVNLVGSFNVAKGAAEIMQHNAPGEDGERGAIINTASVAAYDGQIGQAAYSASKAGVVGMTLPMARELARFGHPRQHHRTGHLLDPDGGRHARRSAAIAQRLDPFPSRLGKPEEFAELVGFILGNRYLNGETIRLDGAVRLAPK
jgi:NAD(P)-dependent dehydrogenase (short-subunit alcohol dehydrogenase family)